MEPLCTLLLGIDYYYYYYIIIIIIIRYRFQKFEISQFFWPNLIKTTNISKG
jgi:hypothetical protein